MKLIASVVAATFFATVGFAEDLASPEGRVLVTIAGAVGATNVPAASEKAVNFSGFMDIGYDKAVGFDDAMLSEMGQHQITANLLDTGKDVTYAGPRLSDVMRTAGAEGRTAFATALDGYVAEIGWDLIETYQPILATSRDGTPLAIGKLGPAMIVFPVIEDKELYSTFSAMEVFATFFIEVE